MTSASVNADVPPIMSKSPYTINHHRTVQTDYSNNTKVTVIISGFHFSQKKTKKQHTINS